ncbi:MAG: alpha-amylase family protein [Gemmatimonadota bacterium]
MNTFPAAPSPLWRRSCRFSYPLAALLILSSGCGGSPSDAGGGNVPPPPPVRPDLPATYRASGHMAAGDVFVHLFDWKWPDIATECETVLGPAGFAAVQISPPQEHSIVPSHDWSERYQPVSYSIGKSRSGTQAEFVDMVNRCKAVGVGIYVDAVINHMTNFPSPGVGSNGTAYTKYDYPGLYTQADFHTPCAITNYQSAANVQDCELFSLPDLNTGLASVRAKIAAYLSMLARLGVAGFRIDAAKHMQQVELDKIFGVVDSTMVAEGRPLPYYFLEVIGGPGEAIRPQDYFGEAYASGGAADITEFTFVGVGDKFRVIGGQHLSQLNPNGSAGNQFSPQAWGLMPSDKAIAFLQNHDTQHNCGISYRDGDVFRLANVWMLAQPYGYPSILSSFAFACPGGNSMGPPSDGNGNTIDLVCSSTLETATIGQWVCEHRDPSILNMVRFRKVVAGTDQNHWWDNGSNAIAFSRGNKGFVAINRESSALSMTITTGLSAGTYCDLITGGLVGQSCAGTTVVVDQGGAIDLQLGAMSAIAIDITNQE